MHLGGWESGDDLGGKVEGKLESECVVCKSIFNKRKIEKIRRKSRMLCEVGAHRDSSHVMTESKV